MKENRSSEDQPETCSGFGRNPGTKLTLLAGVKKNPDGASPQSGGRGVQSPPWSSAGPASREKREARGLAARELPGAEPARPGKAAPRSSRGPKAATLASWRGGDPLLPAGWGRLGRGELAASCSAAGTPSLRAPAPAGSPALPGRPSPGSGSRMRWVGAPLDAPLCSDTGTQTGPRARGRGEVGRRGGGLAWASRQLRPRARSPSGGPALQSPRGRVAGGADSLRCCWSLPASAWPRGRPLAPRSPTLYPEGAWVRAGGRRRAAVSGRAGRALRGARAEGCALLCPHAVRNLGPSWLRRWRPLLRVQGRRMTAGGPGPRAPPRASSPPPAPPRHCPRALPGGTGPGPRTCLRDPFARSFSGQTPGRAWGVPLPGHPAHLPPHFIELCTGLRAPQDSWAAAPGAASAPAGAPSSHQTLAAALSSSRSPKEEKDLSFLAHKPEPFPWSSIPGQHPAEPSFG